MVRLFSLFIVILAMGACTEGAFLPGKSKDDKKSDAIDQETVDEPVMTGGAYLVCSGDKDIAVADTDVGVGCRMENSKSEKLALKAPTEWDILLLVEDIETAMKVNDLTSDEAARWHWHMHIAKDKTKNAILRVVFSEPMREPVPYEAPVAEAIAEPVAVNFLVNSIESFPTKLRFGDDSYNNGELNPGCNPLPTGGGLGNEISSATGRRGNGGEFKFKADTQSIMSISMDICGLETTSKDVRVSIYEGDKLIRTEAITSGEINISFNDVTILEGKEYRLVFSPTNGDDYVVRTIAGTSQFPITVTAVPPAKL